MKKMMTVLLAAVLMLSLAVSASAEEDERIIRVSGNATVSLAADTATIQIGVNTRNESVKDAQAENAALMAAVMKALQDAGIEDKDIVTSQFNVYTDYDYSTSVLGNETRRQFYCVQNNVSVTIHDLSQIGKVLDAAMDAGANTTYGISFSSTKQNDAYQKALTRAVEDAAAKAQVLTAAAGVQLGELTLINAVQNVSGSYRELPGIANSFQYDAKAAAEGTSITSGDVSVTAEVVLEYRIQ